MISLISQCYNQLKSIKIFFMNSESIDLQSSSKKSVAKKGRTGRWSQRQVYLFESLLERYGKNWRKIHEHMKIRSLSQIRSHAQKYFERIGPKRVEEFERRAKLLEAYEILQKEKRDKVDVQIQESTTEKISQSEKEPKEVKAESKQEQRKASIELQSSLGGKQSEIIKQQAPELSNTNQVQAPQTYIQPFPMFYSPTDNQSFLYNLIFNNRESFFNHGIFAFVDSPQFHPSSPLQLA